MKPEVLIVGAGPVGLTLAIELTRYKVPIRIVDKTSQRSDKSKALVIWSRSLELLERSGVSARLIDAGYKVDAIKVSADARTIGRFTFEGLESKTKYPFGLMVPQSSTERVLEEFLNGLGVAVERSIELTTFTASEDGVVSTLRHGDGREETLETSWLIGCDGAHSTVRHLLGREFLGETLLIDWILADVHLENTRRTPEIDVFWHPEGVLAIFPIVENRYRIIADVGSVSDDSPRRDEANLADLQAVLDKRFPAASVPLTRSGYPGFELTNAKSRTIGPVGRSSLETLLTFTVPLVDRG
jgi:2-polyprenyl-6-methoxyphenol hydroxylase-like FAD-dependent oxidoreductase